MAILIIICVSLGVSNVSLGSIESQYEDLFLLPFHNQSREAELIILGHVLDKKLIWERSVGTPLDNYTPLSKKYLREYTRGIQLVLEPNLKLVATRQNSIKMNGLFFFYTRNRY